MLSLSLVWNEGMKEYETEGASMIHTLSYGAGMDRYY